MRKPLSLVLALCLVLPPTALAQEGPPANSPPVINPNKCWIVCYWSSKDSRGKKRGDSANHAGEIAMTMTRELKLDWKGGNIANEASQQLFLTYVGADHLPKPFADILVIQRIWDVPDGDPVAAPTFVSFPLDMTEDQIKADFLAYLEKTKTPPSKIDVSVTEWVPPHRLAAATSNSVRAVGSRGSPTSTNAAFASRAAPPNK